jgi:tetratricopeptide (TPR) repeat protein
MASLASVNDRTTLFAVYDALRSNGGVELGDLALASAGVLAATTDAQFADSLKPATVAQSPIAAYLRASKAYAQSSRSDRLKVTHETGFVGALWTLREVVALYAADKDRQAVDRLLSLGDRAFELRLIGASATANRYQMKPKDVARAWDAVARGEYKNLARAQAAMALANRGHYDAAAERIVQLVADLDLDAPAPALQSMQYYFQQSRRGYAGWQLVWSQWRQKVLAGSSFDHVMSLLQVARYQGGVDIPVILNRAAELAGDDTERVIAVARAAMASNQHTLGHALLEPLVKQKPTRELLHMVATNALSQGRTGEALQHLEAAQALGGDEAVSLSKIRGELSQIISVARQLAVQTTGTAREQAVARAVHWGTKWRAIDPANPSIDQQLGDLMLVVGNKAEAWRYLSSVVERDPMSGDGYQTIAQAFEAQGRVADALEYWHQATILDQTNPTPRMRHAQALIALGRTAEGDKILGEIAARKWHERYSGIEYQAKALLERGKAQANE